MTSALRASVLGIAASTLALAAPAYAQSEQTYRIDSNSDSTINLDICAPVVELYANGDDDTDLDFWVYDNNGNQIHTDVDSTDMTIYTIRSGAGGGRCLPYRLKVHNYGNVYNNMLLRLTNQGGSGGGGGGGNGSNASYRIEANSDSTINLDICAPEVRLVADGDNDTDLDFWIYDNNGNQIHTDTDRTDVTYYTIRSSAGGGRCLPYRLKVHNYGNVYNQMSLTLTNQGGGGGGGTGVYQLAGNGGTGRVSSFSIRSEGNSNQSYALSLCAPSVYMEVRGDGDTDLDFWVTDQNGNEVHRDTDSTDITFATLRSNGRANNCANYGLRIRNYGNVYNQVEVKLTEQ
jgi:hypothetical protein